MAVERSHARLGFFIVVAFAVILATALLFIQRMRSREVIELVTYTNENVSGLDISSPVRFRGVPVGRVTDIRVDPGGRTIELSFEVFRDRLVTIGANVASIEQLAQQAVFPKLRTQVVGNPVTGEAYLLMDVPADPPPAIPLAFTPTRPYVASMPSPLSAAKERLPEVLERAEETLATIRTIVARVPASLDRSDRFFANVERIFQDSQLPQLSADSRKFFVSTNAQFERITADMERLAGPGGTIDTLATEARTAVTAADLPASTRTVREALDEMSLAAEDLRRTLPAIRASLDQLRELTRRLEEQPESVLYGPRPPKGAKR